MTPPPAQAVAPRRAPAARRRASAPRGPRRFARAGLSAGAGRLALPALPRLRPRGGMRAGAGRLARGAAAGAVARAGTLLRGRGLIVVLGAALLGLVFLQVTLLKLNTSISANVQRAQALERDNASQRALLARLDAGQRIQDVAAQLGMVMPAAGAVCYLESGRRGGCSGGDPAAAGDAVNLSAGAPVAGPQAGEETGAPADPAAAGDGTADEAAGTAPAPEGTGEGTGEATAPAGDETSGAPPAQAQAPTGEGDASGGLAAGTGG